MSVSLLHADNTALANGEGQGIGSTNVDNSKSLINIEKFISIPENRKNTNCIIAVCEKQPNVIYNLDVDKHNTKDINPDSEKKLVRTYLCKANDLKGINTSGGPSKEKHKHFQNTKGGDTDSEVEKTQSRNAVQRTIDTQCQANDGDGCYLESTDHRKIVSQYFGRNKRCTQLLTDDLWLVWCRKHYQQRRYNLQQEGIWHLKKLELVKIQIERFKESDRIASWDIVLHKTEQIRLNKENAAAVLPGAETPASPVWERFLEPYLGFNKSYAELYVVLGVIEAEFQTTAFAARDNKDKDMPAIEFLPVFPKGTANKPVTRPKNKTLTPHVKAKGKPPTFNNAPQTMIPESTDKTATLDITGPVDKVPVLPSSSSCKRKASSPIPLDKNPKMQTGCFCSSRPDPSPFTSEPDAVFTTLSSHNKRQASSLIPFDNLVSDYPDKPRRRLVQGIRPKTLQIKTEETE